MPTKTLVAKRTIQKPGAKYKPIKIDPQTGGHLDPGAYEIEEIAPGNTFTLDDEDEAKKLVERGCAEWAKEEKDEKPAPVAPVPPKTPPK